MSNVEYMAGLVFLAFLFAVYVYYVNFFSDDEHKSESGSEKRRLK